MELKAEAEADEVSALMERYQAGDAAAFEGLYSLLAGPLRAYLRSLAPPGADVEDLLQNTFLQVHRSRRTYLPGQPARPWLFAIARHMGLMSRRSSGRRAAHEVTAPDELPEVAVEPSAAGFIDRLALERALGTLAEPGREALWLHHVEGFSFREVAAIQGITPTAAKVRAHRALAVLRGRWAEARA